MIPVAIFLFLASAVLAWRFRVWILVPVSLIATLATVLVELSLGAGWGAALGHGLLISLIPQLGYALGLLAQSTQLALRSGRSARRAFVTTLYRLASTDQARR